MMRQTKVEEAILELQALGGAENDTLYDGQGLARRWGGEGEVCLDASVHVW